MTQKLGLDAFLNMLNDYPAEDCVVQESALEDFDFDIYKAAELSGRELRQGAEYVKGTSFRKRIYVLFRKEED